MCSCAGACIAEGGLCCNTGCRERWASHLQKEVGSPHLLGFCGISYAAVTNSCYTQWALQHKIRWNRAVTNSHWKPQRKVECRMWATFLHLWKVPNASLNSKSAVWVFFFFKSLSWKWCYLQFLSQYHGLNIIYFSWCILIVNGWQTLKVTPFFWNWKQLQSI